MVGFLTGDTGTAGCGGGAGESRRLPFCKGTMGGPKSLGVSVKPGRRGEPTGSVGDKFAGLFEGCAGSTGRGYIGLLKLGGATRRDGTGSWMTGTCSVPKRNSWRRLSICPPWDGRPFRRCGELDMGGVDLELTLLESELEDSLEELDSVGV